MRRSRTSVLPVVLSVLVLAISVAAGTGSGGTADKSAQAKYLTAEEKAVIGELSMARTQPKVYAQFLVEHRKRFVDEKFFQGPGGKRIVTKEGVKAVDEAIAALRKVKPASALSNSGGLFLAAKAHVDDIGPAGILGHKGTDGSTPEERIKRFGTVLACCGENIAFGPDQAREIVMQLIVDDGVPDRGHRTNIYKDAYKVVGVCIGSHEKYGTMCVMDFAGGLAENRDAQKKLRELEKSRAE